MSVSENACAAAAFVAAAVAADDAAEAGSSKDAHVAIVAFSTTLASARAADRDVEHAAGAAEEETDVAAAIHEVDNRAAVPLAGPNNDERSSPVAPTAMTSSKRAQSVACTTSGTVAEPSEAPSEPHKLHISAATPPGLRNAAERASNTGTVAATAGVGGTVRPHPSATVSEVAEDEKRRTDGPRSDVPDSASTSHASVTSRCAGSGGHRLSSRVAFVFGSESESVMTCGAALALKVDTEDVDKDATTMVRSNGAEVEVGETLEPIDDDRLGALEHEGVTLARVGVRDSERVTDSEAILERDMVADDEPDSDGV